MSVNPNDIAALTQMYNSAGRLQQQKIQNDYKLGKAQLANAMKIASMNSKDTRYGIEATREVGLANIAQAREEMERVGIPRMEIERWVAEKEYELAQVELAFRREVQEQENALARGELTGEFEGNPTLAARRMERELGLAEGELTGSYNGQRTLAGRQQDLDEAERQRQYQMQLAEFQAELNSTPDTYFQARSFQANDLPRLLGQGTQYGAQQTGSPTPGIARMGQYLAQGYGAPTGGSQPGPSASGAAAGAPAGPPAGGGADGMVYASGAGAATGAGGQVGVTGPGFNPNAAAQRPAAAAGAGTPTYAGNGAQPAPPSTTPPPTPYGGMAPAPNLASPLGPAAGEWGRNVAAGEPMLPQGQGSQPDEAARRAASANDPMLPQGQGLQPDEAARRAASTGEPAFADERAKQIAQIAKAVPPSPFDGLSDSDAASLRLMQSIYSKGGQSMANGEYERLRASGRLGFLKSAGRMLGYDPAELESSYMAYRPSQGDSRLAG